MEGEEFMKAREIIISEDRLQRLETLVDAAKEIIPTERPHGGLGNHQFPDGCECDQCEKWDKWNKALKNDLS